VLSLIVSLLSWALPVRADPAESCRSPRAAVDSLFGWLAPEHHNPTKAARCLERAGRTTRELKEAALRIKLVCEARAIRIDPAQFSDEAGWINPETRRAAFVLSDALPELTVEKQADGNWRFTRATLDAADDLYEQSLAASESRLMRHLPGWLRTKLLEIELWQLGALALIVAAAIVLRQLIRAILKNRLARLAERRGALLVAEIIKVFATPGAALLGAAGLELAYPELGLPLRAALALSSVVRVIVVVAVVLALYRLVDVLAVHLATRAAEGASPLDAQFVPLIKNGLKVVLVLLGLLVLLQNLGVNVASLLAGLGIGGLAVALAAKETIANFLGSVMIYVDRPFRIGDWVKIEDVEGRVEEVGFRTTRIRTLSDSVVALPNARCAEAKIDNFGARRFRRIHATLSLTYDTPVPRIQAFVEAIRAVISAHPKTRKDEYEVHFSSLGSHSLDVMLHCYVEAATWSEELAARHALFLQILRVAEALGVRFAFPTRTLHVETVAAAGAGAVPVEIPPPERLAELVQQFGPGGKAARPKLEITESYASGPVSRR
jgi:MscS family membrane protein